MQKKHYYYVYIMASRSGTLYIGMTNNIYRRVHEHKNGLIEGFAKKYKCTRFIYFECTTDVYAAIAREKQLKKWGRSKKESLIRKINPQWKDLSKKWKLFLE